MWAITHFDIESSNHVMEPGRFTKTEIPPAMATWEINGWQQILGPGVVGPPCCQGGGPSETQAWGPPGKGCPAVFEAIWCCQARSHQSRRGEAELRK